MAYEIYKIHKPELEEIKENANFTEEEERIFSLLCRGFSQKQISTKENIVALGKK